jgi:hypothetical protein
MYLEQRVRQSLYLKNQKIETGPLIINNEDLNELKVFP